MKTIFFKSQIILFSGLIFSHLLALLYIENFSPLNWTLPTEVSLIYISLGLIYTAYWFFKGTLREKHTNLASAGLIYLVLPLFWGAFRAWKQWYPTPSFGWDLELAAIDQFLGFGQQPWEYLRPIYQNEGLLWILDQCYVLWFFWLFLWISWAAWASDRSERLRFFFGLMQIWIIEGIILAKIFSSAGPCFWRNLNLPDTYKEPVIALLHTQTNLKSYQFQTGLWEDFIHDQHSFFGGISAFPSLHVGIAVFLALHSYAKNRLFGSVAWAYAFVIWIASIVLLWHFAIDGIIASIASVIIFKLQKMLTTQN